MKTFKILLIVLILFPLVSCKKNIIISVPKSDVTAYWSKYIKAKITDKTLDKEGFIYPEVTLEFKKVFEKEIYSFKFLFHYNYAGKHFEKEEIISFDYELEEMKKFNNGETITINFKYPKVQKIVLKENEEFFIPMHGVIPQGYIIEIKYIK